MRVIGILVDEFYVAVRPRVIRNTVIFDAANRIYASRDGSLDQVIRNGWIAYGSTTVLANLWRWCSHREIVEVYNLGALQFSRGCNKLVLIPQGDGSIQFEYTKGSVIHYNLADVTDMVKSTLPEPVEVLMTGSLSHVTMKRGALLKALEERIAQLDKAHEKKVAKREKQLLKAFKTNTLPPEGVTFDPIGRDGEWYWMHQKLAVVKASCDKEFEIGAGDIARIMAAPSVHGRSDLI